nr:DUF6470 family protein [Heyndrickxia oleronia]
MKLPQIRLESQYAKIQMDTTPATQSIEQPKAEIDIQQPRAELHINRTPSKFTVDQSQAWADMDLKPISKRIEEFSQNGYKEWLNGIARRAQEGEQMMKFEKEAMSLPLFLNRTANFVHMTLMSVLFHRHLA